MRFRWIFRRVLILIFGLLLAGVSTLSAADCNGNGQLDVDDVSRGESDDCNGNGVPDECEVAPLPFSLPRLTSSLEMLGVVSSKVVLTPSPRFVGVRRTVIGSARVTRQRS